MTLGLPLLTKKMTSLDYSTLLDKIRGRINSWTARALSFAGRLQLIASVISSLINFWIAAFRLPKRCIEEIESLCSAFLWSGPDLNPRKAKIIWKDVCKPKKEGELGLKCIRLANEVGVMKLIWRLLTGKNSLWATWTRQNLMRGLCFWSLNAATIHGKGSWIWKQILKCRNQAESFFKIDLRSGRQTSFWHDRWSSLGNLFKRFGSRGFIDLGIQERATVEEAMQTHRRRRHRSSDLNKVEDDIDLARMQYKQDEDDIGLWRLRDGIFKPQFRTNSTREQLRNVQPSVVWSHGVWFRYHSPKFAFITWITIHNHLSTGDRMLKWNQNVATNCIFCSEQVETRDNLFFSCPYSKAIWTNVAKGTLLQNFSSEWNDMIQHISYPLGSRVQSFTIKYLFQLTVYMLWKERNKRRHGAIPIPKEVMIKLIDKEMRSRFSSIRLLGDYQFAEGLQNWFASRPQD